MEMQSGAVLKVVKSGLQEKGMVMKIAEVSFGRMPDWKQAALASMGGKPKSAAYRPWLSVSQFRRVKGSLRRAAPALDPPSSLRFVATMKGRCNMNR